MNEIIVKSQEEFEKIPQDYNGRIYIEFGTPYNRAVINRVFKEAVVVLMGNSSAVLWENSSAELWGNSSAVLRENSSAVLRENSSAVLWENSSAVLRENSSAVLWENSSAVLWGNSSAVLRENSSAELWENSRAVLMGNSSAVLRENSRAELRENSRAELRGNSSAVLRENSRAELRGNSSAVLRENSSAELWGNSQAVDVEAKGNVKVNGNARVVYLPRNIKEYIKYYNLDSTDEYVTLYKAVHKHKGKYFSDYDTSFYYEIGKTAESPKFSNNVSQQCGDGIHLAHLAYALDFGEDWSNCAILECRAKKEDVVLPIPNKGKVRVPRCEVIREVPLEECGLYGKMLAKRRANND